MVFLDFIKGLGLDTETFCPFDIEVVNGELDAPGDENIESDVSFHKKLYTDDLASVGGDERQLGRVCVDDSSCVQSAGTSVIQDDRSCSNCDFWRPIEDFELGSGENRCSVRGVVIDDMKQSASTCSSYYCSELDEDM
ncbi:hypothetical protein JCM15519_23020 [Fundidesulfovibrio butyratiphilus]